ncbi:TIGR01906 family membrane protein [Vagococcus elongatus]|uniref:TIGR01906 family membrane protein n=1 Tax=Vagococcus elongatus TaxID=180344 RepID=A0A430AMS1_9ENTE|nr:TIGR01906 family membrane protein [Vagococcus elongatus]RSU09207.1 hypothetical protein CBF29_12115 [Vagococcus elongatus]
MIRTNWKEKVGLACLMLTVITLAITITINAFPLYVFDIGHLDILDRVALSQEELLKNYRELMSYLNFPWISQLKMTDFPVSASGAFHFWEVKKLFLLNYGVFLLTVIPSTMFLRKLWKEKRLWILNNGLTIAALVPVFLGFFMFVGFDKFFTTFHHVFFNNDAWIFDPELDPIILALPEQYFFHSFILAIVLFELIILGIIYIGRRQFKSKN